MTKQTYKMLDLTFFIILACLFDAINIWAFKRFPLGGFTLTLHIVLALIAMIRWGYLGSVVAIVGGFSYCLFVGGLTIESILAYSLGNILIICNIGWFIKIKKDKLVANKLYLILYVITGFAFISIGRGLISSLIVGNFMAYMSNYFLFESFNMIIGIIITIIGSKQNGFVEDMNSYLIRVKKEDELRQKALKKEVMDDESSEIS